MFLSSERREAATLSSVSSRLTLLVDLAALLAREIELDRVIGTACERLASAMSADRATVWLLDGTSGELVSRVADAHELPQLRLPLGLGIAGAVATSGEVVRVDDARSEARFHRQVDTQTGYVTKSMLCAPIRSGAGKPIRGVVQVLNAKSGAFTEEDERYLIALSAQLSAALDLTTLRPLPGVAGVSIAGPFNRIVGSSKALASVYERVSRTAETDASVLLLGETGTGKGIFARAIHVNSARQAGPFVTVDATTLPNDLVESELFGHERGAFTGADRRVPGKVELAQGGTLFLDEVGDLPLPLQGKLLRFLQEKAFERVGGRETLRADVRILAATHRDLGKLVREGAFRADLYYRLRVVEIELPPLRDRGRQDILALSTHFADTYARRYGRPKPTFAGDAIERLTTYAFPGNVRELEHWIESAVVLSIDGELRASSFPRAETAGAADGEMPDNLPLAEMIARYAARTLAACNGNQSEAAKRLQIGRNTLRKYLKQDEDP